MQQDMRYVYEIYRQKSFSKAAQALFITQPALSIAIGKLEASLGIYAKSERVMALAAEILACGDIAKAHRLAEQITGEL